MWFYVVNVQDGLPDSDLQAAFIAVNDEAVDGLGNSVPLNFGAANLDAVPEPGTGLMLIFGLLNLAWRARRVR